MENCNVIKARKHRDGYFELTVSDPLTDKKEIQHYIAIRGGIHWPTTNSPAYACIVGQLLNERRVKNEKNIEQTGKRVLLAEHRSDSLFLSKSFYQVVIDLAEQFLCKYFYVDMPEDRYECGFLNDFSSFASERNSISSLVEALDVDNFILGISRIKEDIDSGRLQLPEDSIVKTQLRELTRETLQENPEETFYAIDGLRHVLSSFYRYKPTLRPQTRARRGPVNWKTI